MDARLILVVVTLLVTGNSVAAIVSPSFESTSGWSASNSGQFGVDTISSSFAGLPTDGASAGRVFSGSGSTINSGNFGQWSQTVDLTTVAAITFDVGIVTLLQAPSGQSSTLMSFLEARVLIDGTPVWSTNSGGTFLNQVIDTSGIAGSAQLVFRLHAIADSNGENLPRISSSWFLFDNLRETVVAPIPIPAPVWLLASALPFLTRGKVVS